MHRYCPLPLLLLTALGLASTPVVAAAPTDTTESAPVLTASLDLDIEVGDPALQSSLEHTLTSAFDIERERYNLRLDEDPRASSDLRVRVHLWEPEPNALVIDVWVDWEGEVFDQQEGMVCMGCTADDVAGKALALLPSAVEHGRAARAEAEPPAPAIEPEAPVAAPQTTRRGAPFGPVGFAGIAAGAVGLGATIAGAVLLHRGNAPTGDSSSPTLTFTDYRPVGLGLIGAGLGVMVVGQVLVGVDLGLLRDRRDQRGPRTQARLDGVGVWTGAGPGLSVHGRF